MDLNKRILIVIAWLFIIGLVQAEPVGVIGFQNGRFEIIQRFDPEDNSSSWIAIPADARYQVEVTYEVDSAGANASKPKIRTKSIPLSMIKRITRSEDQRQRIHKELIATGSSDKSLFFLVETIDGNRYETEGVHFLCPYIENKKECPYVMKNRYPDSGSRSIDDNWGPPISFINEEGRKLTFGVPSLRKYVAYKDEEYSTTVAELGQYGKNMDNARRELAKAESIREAERQKEQQRMFEEQQRILAQQNALKEIQERRQKKIIQDFRVSLKEGDTTHCGLVVEVKQNIVKVQTMIGEHWLKRSQIYPEGKMACRFINGESVKRTV